MSATAPHPPDAPSGRLAPAVALLSASVIAYQICIMQILSCVQWHHFASLVIALALLGFGASGVLLAALRERVTSRVAGLFSTGALLAGVLMPVAVWVTQLPGVRFDSYGVFFSAGQAAAFLITCVVYALPFFCAASAIGAALITRAASAGRMYFANLAGSALGGGLAVVLLETLTPAQLPAAAALPAIAAGMLMRRRGGGLQAVLAVAGLTVAAVAWSGAGPPLAVSEYKGISGALRMPDAAVTDEARSAQGFLQVVAAPALRYNPGQSLQSAVDPPVLPMAYVNGDPRGPVLGAEFLRPGHPADRSTAAFPYVLRCPGRVLVLESATGWLATHALSRGAEAVVAAERHPGLRGLLERSGIPHSSGGRLALINADARSLLAWSGPAFDLILLPPQGAVGGTAGLTALEEQYMLTEEGMQALWRRLAPGGVLCVPVWMDEPYRMPLRLVATVAEHLERCGVADPRAHIAAVRSWGVMSVAVTRSPLTEAQIDSVRAFCRRQGFDVALLPGTPRDEAAVFHTLQDTMFARLLDSAVGARRSALYERYPFSVRPATDDRPFFAQFFRASHLQRARELVAAPSVAFLELGYFLAFLSLGAALVLSAVFVVGPALVATRGTRRPLRTVLLFACLGVGYMLVEVMLIHRFVLLFGTPVVSAAGVIGLLLVAAGAGSWWSSRLGADARTVSAACMAVAAAVVLLAFASPPLVRAVLGSSGAMKLLVAAALVIPLGFVMGMPFPLALRATAERAPSRLPWAWGVNGALSVVGSALATILAAEAGIAATLIAAACVYLLGGAVWFTGRASTSLP